MHVNDRELGVRVGVGVGSGDLGRGVGARIGVYTCDFDVGYPTRSLHSLAARLRGRARRACRVARVGPRAWLVVGVAVPPPRAALARGRRRGAYRGRVRSHCTEGGRGTPFLVGVGARNGFVTSVRARGRGNVAFRARHAYQVIDRATHGHVQTRIAP